MMGLTAECISNAFVFDNRVYLRGSTPNYHIAISLRGGQPSCPNSTQQRYSATWKNSLERQGEMTRVDDKRSQLPRKEKG